MPRVGDVSPRAAVAAAVAMAAWATLGVTMAFTPERARTAAILWILGGTFGLGAVATVAWLRHRGELRQQLTPTYGDVTKGFLAAAGLYGAAYLLHQLLTARGSPREPWILRAYLHVGDPMASGAWIVPLAVMAVAACEELLWRGGVMSMLTAALGRRRAWWLTTLLYALSYGATVYLLRDPWAGPNPLLVVGALVGGAVWGALVLLLGRLPPVVIAHGLCVWALVAFPLWRP